MDSERERQLPRSITELYAQRHAQRYTRRRAERRPAVTIVVPFGGPAAELEEVVRRFAKVELSAADELVFVDNSPDGPAPAPEELPAGGRVVRAAELGSPGYARNAGAAEARGEWLLFLDADTDPVPKLLYLYFGYDFNFPDTAILAGGVESYPEDGTLAIELAHHTGLLDPTEAYACPYRPYALSANCAVRADAFRAVGGFEPRARAGEDADLCWRLQDAGYRLELRLDAVAWHRSRERMRDLWRQQRVHGAGAAWLNRRYPGAMPPWGVPALVHDGARVLWQALVSALRGDRGRLTVAAGVVSMWWAFELGRLRSNEPRAPRR